MLFSRPLEARTVDEELDNLDGEPLTQEEELTLDEELQVASTRDEVIQSAAEWPDQNNPAASL